MSISTRSNIFVLFQLVDISKPKLFTSPLSFFINVWLILVLKYPHKILYLHLVMLFYFGYLIGYQDPDAFIESKNMFFTLIKPNVIEKNIGKNFILGKIIQIYLPPNTHSISSLLGLILKHNGGFRKIYYLTYSNCSSVNDYIASKFRMLFYSSLKNVFSKIISI